jgi:hypothetical protein
VKCKKMAAEREQTLRIRRFADVLGQWETSRLRMRRVSKNMLATKKRTANCPLTHGYAILMERAVVALKAASTGEKTP